MQSDCATKRENGNGAAGAAKHDGEANDRPDQCQSAARFVLFADFTGTNAPLPSSRYIVDPTREI